jgi:hypothetical protein
MQVLLRRNPQVSPCSFFDSLYLLPNDCLVRLLLGTHDDFLVLNGIVPLVEVKVRGEEPGDHGNGSKDEGN